ncbi:MAG: 4Fe-4S dicluster domain-containing protein [Candidatus Zixiibacteriota bacterium]
MNKINKRMIEKLREVFEKEKLDVMIGFQESSVPLRAAPLFADSLDKLDKMIFGPSCYTNLAKYIADEKKRDKMRKIGFIAKGCDGRAILELISENQISRENIVIIALPCEGVIDPNNVRKALQGRDFSEYEIDDDKVILKGRNFNVETSLSKLRNEACATCKYPNAPVYDYIIGEAIDRAEDSDQFERVTEFDKLSDEERWAYFEKEFSKCIRCYACRNVCPMCYCEECFVDQKNPKWFGKSVEKTDTTIFHIVRMLHVAGRCVDCGACAASCPTGVDLRLLGKRLEKEVLDRFGYIPGLDPEEPPAPSTFSEDDEDEFIM